MRVLDVAGIGAAFSAATILGLTVGFYLGRQTGNGLWMVAGLFAGLLVGGLIAGKRFAALMQPVPPTLARDAIKVEEGSFATDVNSQNASTGLALLAYFERKRTVGVRAAVFICVMSAIAAVFGVRMGLDVLLGGACGIANILLIMKHNESLLGRGRGMLFHLARGRLRMVGFAAIAAMVTIWSPWWAMGLFFGGFFAPLTVYAIQLRNEIVREAACTNR